MTITKKLLTLGVVAGILVAIFAFLPAGIRGAFLGSSVTTRNYVATGKFVTTWKTDNIGVSKPNQITILTSKSYKYNNTIDWGDGKKNTKVTKNITHTYKSPGTYTVTISGAFPYFYA
jgi:PKD repeat protein